MDEVVRPLREDADDCHLGAHQPVGYDLARREPHRLDLPLSEVLDKLQALFDKPNAKPADVSNMMRLHVFLTSLFSDRDA